MEHLWSKGPRDAREVHRRVGRERGITLNTIQSTLRRLYEKGFLERTKVSHAYVYEPRLEREAFRRRMLGDVVEHLMEGESEAMLQAFVDLTEQAGREELARLERLVALRRARLDTDEGE